ncbi:hypothetical protein HDF16_001081 [Granulicella aggregans]|uniref:TonB-dependent transporter Oar-like beta-barrel domain-containing protein n=1 Tax=Granulicella aggregans TaxID=474949 RepID=A0A7W7ZAX6_9BACT|nr:carboxypeptidase regulatory-like domain-containing protein [Granulicella aggregans]MBB5056412.1 hypothetical protein [Granulicella aggregans]
MQSPSPDHSLNQLWIGINSAQHSARKSKWIFSAMIALALSCVGTKPLAAQFRTSVQGTVTDPQGAVIPGAKVTLKDTANNAEIIRTSDGAGLFNFGALPPDTFTLTVEAKGFQKNVLTNIKFIPEQPNSLNVALTLGASDVSVEVNASSTPTLDTETANIGGTISAADIKHLPSFNRDVFTLSQLAPGAISDGSQSRTGGVYQAPGNQGPGGSGNGGSAPTENGPQVNSNGQQYGNNGISLDGISTVSAVWGGTSIITPSPEAVDNVRIVTNGYDAENGRFSGAQTMVTTKSGTNQIHGSLFIDAHRPGLNAANRPVRASDGTIIGSSVKDTDRYNQYGGSVGGPIWKDKVFAFFAYETSPDDTLSTSTGWYETPSLRSSAPAASIASQFVNFAGNAPSGTIVTSGETCKAVGLQEGANCATIAGQGLDIGSPLTNGLGKQDPTAGGTTSNPGLGNGLDGTADVAFYSIASPVSSTYTQYAGRLDAQATKNDHVSFTMFWVPSTKTSYNGSPRAYNLFHHDQINQANAVIWNHTFSPTFLNEARANAAAWRYNELATNPQQPLGLPQDTVDFAPGATLGTFGSPAGNDLNQWTFSYKDVATKVLGSHTVKFGGEYTALHYLQNPSGQPDFEFYNIWTFLNDAPYQEAGSFNAATGIPGGVRSDQRQNLFGAFVQDDWRAKPNLTLHAGIRYNYFGALYSKQNNIPNVTLGQGTAAYTGLTVGANKGGIWNPQKLNFGPQFSFNWSPQSLGGKTVIRGGYGMAFNQNEIAITANASFNPPISNSYTFRFNSPTDPGANGPKILYGISSDITSLNGYASNPNTITTYTAAGLPAAGSASIIIAGDGHGNVPTTYFHHFSLDIQQELSKWAVFTLGYQGSLGRHIINHQTPNAPAAVAGVPFNQLVTGGDFWVNAGSSRNHALLASINHPMSHGFSAQAQFMWAKSQDTDGSGPYSEDPYYPLSHSLTYGLSDYNVGKSLKIFGTWQPVLFHGDKRWVEKIAGGWNLSGIFSVHTGFPYSALYNLPSSLYCNNCGYTQLRASYLGGAKGGHSNSDFINNTNFAGQATGEVKTPGTVNGNAGTVAYSNRYFAVANFQNTIQLQSTANVNNPTVALPNLPGSQRNIFDGPNYHNLDASLSKSFGLPKLPVLGEDSHFEIRANALNLFNILNLDVNQVNKIVDSGSFGQDQTPLGGRIVTLSARFEF